MKKRGRKHAKTDIEKVNAQNSKFWVLSAKIISKTGGTAKLTVWQRNMLLQKMVNGCNIARLNTNTRVVEVGKKRPMWWTGCCQIGN